VCSKSSDIPLNCGYMTIEWNQVTKLDPAQNNDAGRQATSTAVQCYCRAGLTSTYLLPSLPSHTDRWDRCRCCVPWRLAVAAVSGVCGTCRRTAWSPSHQGEAGQSSGAWVPGHGAALSTRWVWTVMDERRSSAVQRPPAGQHRTWRSRRGTDAPWTAVAWRQ